MVMNSEFKRNHMWHSEADVWLWRDKEKREENKIISRWYKNLEKSN